MKSLNIYIHIPFCFAKCPYCAFYSCTKSEFLYEKYFKRLKEEVSQRALEYKNNIIKTIYIGGGTPNLVPSKYIIDILKQVKREFNIDKDIEVSIELNPEYISRKQLENYKQIGINRISIGLQTTKNRDLTNLSRRYTYEQFLEKYNLIKELGFGNIGIDLIFGYPYHTIQIWSKTLEIVTNLDIQHISTYSLEIEEGTPYKDMEKKGILNIPSDDINRDMYHLTCEYLPTNGFNQYEISNFAKGGYECRHNLNFWNYENYLGIGAGAYSRIDNRKFHNSENIDKYILGIEVKPEYISNETIEKEKMILGLRLNKGIKYDNKIFDKQYMIREKRNMHLNKSGKDFYNLAIEQLL